MTAINDDAPNVDYSKIYEQKYGKQRCNKHASIFPNNIFMIIAGSTGCGKTNLIMNFLLENLLNYDNVIIYTTTPYQEAYTFLRDVFQKIRSDNNIRDSIISFYNSDEPLIDPSQLDKNKSHIVIFDDVLTEDQKGITDYFCRGRHNNVNIFYLCQSIHKLKKHCIRQNANIFVLFNQDSKTLKYFYDTHISGDMLFEEFKKICDEAWMEKHGYIVVNLWEDPECGRYLLNYNKLYIPQKYLNIPNNT